MKQIEAKIIADSINRDGKRITTFLLTFPRFILAELNTHRMFSRNSASSRAIPFKKMVKMVNEDPFIPIAWQIDHTGMQGTEYLRNPSYIDFRRQQWMDARDAAVKHATRLNTDIHQNVGNGQRDFDVKIIPETGVTKQLCNRLLEAFMWHTCIVTATEFDNFFDLRTPQYTFEEHNDFEEVTATHVFHSKKDALASLNNFYSADREKFIEDFDMLDWLYVDAQGAEIHMRLLAESMWDAYNENKPQLLEAGQWHIPFGDSMDEAQIDKLMPTIQPASLNWYIDTMNAFKRKVAVARCARLSYNTHDGDIDYQKDVAMYNKLANSGHMSPFEHVAMAVDGTFRYGNLIGWISERSMLEAKKERKEIV